MGEYTNRTCSLHSNPFECPDSLVYYSVKFDEYSLIIHDGGSSSVDIEYCPWCGTKLPESKRDAWFDKLEELGYDDPFEQNIPEKFHTDEWYNEK